MLARHNGICKLLRGSLQGRSLSASVRSQPRQAPATSSPLLHTIYTQRARLHTKMTIDESVLKHYLADSPPTIVPLAIKPHFEALSEAEKHYSHFLSV